MPPAVDGPRSSAASDRLPPLADRSPHVEALAARGAERRFRAGTLIIQEGERGDTLYIVRSGRLRAFVADDSGKELTLGLYGPGEYVGEMSLDGGPRSASVEAAEPTVCALIQRDDLLAYIAEQPTFALELMARLIRRARLATENARSMALVDVYGRLTRLLDQLAESPDADGARALRERLTHQQIAHHLACSREMVSRVMKDLEERGVIETQENGSVIIKERAAQPE